MTSLASYSESSVIFSSHPHERQPRTIVVVDSTNQHFWFQGFWTYNPRDIASSGSQFGSQVQKLAADSDLEYGPYQHQQNVQLNFGQLSQLSKVVKLLKLCKLWQLLKVRYKNFQSYLTTLKGEQPSFSITLVVWLWLQEHNFSQFTQQL